MVLPLEERKKLLFEQLAIHAKKLVDELDKVVVLDAQTLQYLVQHSAGIWQYAQKLQKEYRIR